jgi:hypothetical protein
MRCGILVLRCRRAGGKPPHRIGFATSDDGVIWEKYNDPTTNDPFLSESDPVFEPPFDGSWESYRYYSASVLSDGNKYEMWYFAAKDCCTPGASAYGYAESSKPDNIGPIVLDPQANPNPVAINNGITLIATVDDSTTGGSVIASAEYRIDDGSWVPMDPEDGSFDESTEGVTASIPAFNESNVHQIWIRGTDSEENVGTEVVILLAVYDPDGGFVTGGGWIDSPEGAYGADPTLSGKANFGFVSKYKKGADIPIGNTQFNFRVADLNFHSDSYQWLVVAGAKATFKGAGIINGAGNYGFLLSAIDADLTPSTDIDLFRIKIWDIDNGDIVVYDNRMDAAEDADPATAIGGGSIVIHDGKKAAPAKPTQFVLLQNYPNPFNPETWIPYQLVKQADVSIVIYSAGGQVVRRLDLGSKMPGYYVDRSRAAYWDGRNEQGEQVSSGVYFYQIKAAAAADMKKMIITR